MIQTGSFSKKRSRILYLLPLGFVILAFRLVYIQIIKHDHYDNLALKQHRYTKPITSQRGTIYDRNKKILATSYRSKSLVAYPNLFKDISEVENFIKEVSPIIEIDSAKIIKRIKKSKKFAWIKRKLTPLQASRIKDRVSKIKGLGFEEEWSRFYPTNAMSSASIGIVGIEHQGLTGLELFYNKLLKGVDGKKEVVQAIRGKTISEKIIQSPITGHDLHLSLDINIQTFLFSALKNSYLNHKPISCSGVVMDVKTGEILAIATIPAHKPGDKIKTKLDGLHLDSVKTVFEPGSTMKPIIYAAALEKKLIKPTDLIHCGNGAERIGGRTLHDVHHYGNLTAEEVIIKSSNIGAAKMGKKLGNARMYETLIRMGFGLKSDLPFKGESKGLLQPYRKWTKFSTASIPMGHEIGITMIQMVRAYAAIGNGGHLLQPLVDKKVINSEGIVVKHKNSMSLNRVFSASTCEKTIQALEQVVQRGTAKRAKSKFYRIAGKTGTTEKLVNGKYVKDKNIGSFVALAPATEPRLVVMIMADEPEGVSYGGTVAAPYVKEVIENSLKYMNVPPDNIEEPI